MSDYRYKPEVLAALLHYGVMPTRTTGPDFIREFLSELYRYEIRKMREEQLALEREHGRQARKGYSDKVVALRSKYPLLSLPVQHWLEHS